MDEQIELHDSRVAIERTAAGLVFRLCPAYVHRWQRTNSGWKGEGRRQQAELFITSGVASVVASGEPFDLAGGEIRVGERVYDNMLPAVLESDASVSGHLDLVSGSRVDFAGAGFRLRLLGDSEHIEDLPPEWAPADGAVQPAAAADERRGGV